MKTRIILLLIVLLGGCRTTSKQNTITKIPETNKDVFVLSILIQDHLRNTNGRELDLKKVIQLDTLGRITNNFEKVELLNRAGHLALKFKFSTSRGQSNIKLNDKETARINQLRWRIKELTEDFDGEIRFDFGERFYYIKKIILKKGSNVADTLQSSN